MHVTYIKRKLMISGSTKDAEEFDQLPPEEAKKRLKILVDKMDSDSDGFVDKSEMNAWILKSFASLSKEESDGGSFTCKNF